jgi:hypothetical protein
MIEEDEEEKEEEKKKKLHLKIRKNVIILSVKSLEYKLPSCRLNK